MPQLMFVLFAGVVSLGIGIALLTKIEFSKKAIMTALMLSNHLCRPQLVQCLLSLALSYSGLGLS